MNLAGFGLLILLNYVTLIVAGSYGVAISIWEVRKTGRVSVSAVLWGFLGLVSLVLLGIGLSSLSLSLWDCVFRPERSRPFCDFLRSVLGR